jgi:single-stranded-DNA-specific exonuclease
VTSPYELRTPDPDAARELGRACGVSATTAQVLLHRGVGDAASAQAFLEPRLSGLTAPDGMADRDRAAERLAAAIRRREKIVVFGDYDVDGTTSAAILADILEALGGDVVAQVANRFEGGYGFSEPALERCRQAGARLIVTCDCGSSDHARIAAAARAGIDVVVVDHHLVPEEPLPAEAFLNPHRPECGFPYKGLASAGLALSLGAATRAALGSRLDVRQWLDLVALGTVADVAPLDGDNRKLVRAGLQRLGAPEVRPGVAALRESARIRAGTPVGAMDIAFRLAPRLNAAGRLGDPTITLRLLRARTLDEARMLAARIEQINQERKTRAEQVTREAMAQVEQVYGAEPGSGVVVAGEGWHRGVVGIAAARLADRFGVPVVCVGIEQGQGHGSVRGPGGVHLYDAVSQCAELLERFGGHEGAAGLSVRPERVERLRAAFADATGPVSAGGGAAPPLVDVEVDGSTFPVPSAADLARLEPVGEANAEPLFAVPSARIEQRQRVGESHLKLSLRLGRLSFSAFGRDLGHLIDHLPDTITALGHLRPDTYRGTPTPELHLDGGRLLQCSSSSPAKR